MVINSDCLKSFTNRDVAFFRIIDGRDRSIEDLGSPEFFQDKPKTNPFKEALFVPLAVLAKSAAALLVARYLNQPPPSWPILAIPYSGATVATDFDAMFGDTRPFDIGVKVWLKACHSGDWFVAYRAQNVLVFFLFHLSGSQEFWDGILARFQDTERLCFEGTRLVDLIAYEWRRV